MTSDGISEHTLRKIYQQIYIMRYVEAVPTQISLLPYREVREISKTLDTWSLNLNHLANHQQENIHADLVVWASGFCPAPMEFLAPLHNRFKWRNNEILVDEDFAAIWDNPPSCERSLFLLNATRNQRGLSDPNLSLIAWRGQLIVNRLLGKSNFKRSLVKEPSFISWSAESSITNTMEYV